MSSNTPTWADSRILHDAMLPIKAELKRNEELRELEQEMLTVEAELIEGGCKDSREFARQLAALQAKHSGLFQMAMSAAKVNPATLAMAWRQQLCPEPVFEIFGRGYSWAAVDRLQIPSPASRWTDVIEIGLTAPFSGKQLCQTDAKVNGQGYSDAYHRTESAVDLATGAMEAHAHMHHTSGDFAASAGMLVQIDTPQQFTGGYVVAILEVSVGAFAWSTSDCASQVNWDFRLYRGGESSANYGHGLGLAGSGGIRASGSSSDISRNSTVEVRYGFDPHDYAQTREYFILDLLTRASTGDKKHTGGGVSVQATLKALRFSLDLPPP